MSETSIPGGDVQVPLVAAGEPVAADAGQRLNDPTEAGGVGGAAPQAGHEYPALTAGVSYEALDESGPPIIRHSALGGPAQADVAPSGSPTAATEPVVASTAELASVTAEVGSITDSLELVMRYPEAVKKRGVADPSRYYADWLNGAAMAAVPSDEARMPAFQADLMAAVTALQQSDPRLSGLDIEPYLAESIAVDQGRFSHFLTTAGLEGYLFSGRLAGNLSEPQRNRFAQAAQAVMENIGELVRDPATHPIWKESNKAASTNDFVRGSGLSDADVRSLLLGAGVSLDLLDRSVGAIRERVAKDPSSRQPGVGYPTGAGQATDYTKVVSRPPWAEA